MLHSTCFENDVLSPNGKRESRGGSNIDDFVLFLYTCNFVGNQYVWLRIVSWRDISNNGNFLFLLPSFYFFYELRQQPYPMASFNIFVFTNKKIMEWHINNLIN